MSGPKRNPDRLNTIGVVVVGVCGAVLVYVSIVALQAFYMNDSSEVQTMADYGGQDTTHKSIRATQLSNIGEFTPNARPEPGKGDQTYRISIDRAIKLVADGAKVDPANLVPTQGRANQPTIVPVFGRPRVAPPPPPSGPDGAGGTQGSTANPGAGSAGAAVGSTSAPMHSTGALGPGGGPTAGQGPTPPAVGAPDGAGATGTPPQTTPKTTTPKTTTPKTTAPKTTAPKTTTGGAGSGSAGKANAPK
ncbi:MAG: hypothetical protein H0T89_12595 [Deltaproteobacteria bacterium]|nr:hypothetical protein [Deltaproteobacteria bacterium]MDQ3295570.1 hypothetical protein [Myxococcota bacterium]